MTLQRIKGSSAFGPAILLLVLLAALSSWSGPVAAQTPERAPDLELRGTISRADFKTYKHIPFRMPEGVDRLVLAFDHDGREQKSVIDLGVADPHGFRGASGGNKPSFTLSQTDATPSYLPGRIDAGEWALSLAVPNIREGVTARWTARLWFLKGAEAQVLPAPTAGRGPGWYRGDLHLHSGHSDGSCASQTGARVPCPLYRTLAAASGRGLDFVAVTEHNTATHAHMLREAQPYFDRMLLIPGREMTTFHGHFNIFGVTAPIDFRIAAGIDNGFDRIADQVHALGGLVSINHPALPSDESCMGCGWTMPGVDYGKVDAVEVVNGASSAAAGNDLEGPVSGVPFWLSQLAGGRAMTAVGGSDNHDPDKAGLGAVGAPVTVVFASDLTQPAVLEGIRAGRSFIAIDPALRSLHLDFTVRAGRAEAVMGGAVTVRGRQPAVIAVDAAGPDGAYLELVQGQTVVGRHALKGGALKASYPLPARRGLHAVHIRLRAADGRLLALGNAVRLHRE